MWQALTLPGMPYVIVGHKPAYAWGFTNVGPTVTDVYIENLIRRPVSNTAGLDAAGASRRTIHIKGKADITVDVRITRHGPIITDLVQAKPGHWRCAGRLRTGLRIPFFDVNAAQNWDEFQHAFSQLDAPGQNVVLRRCRWQHRLPYDRKVPIRTAGVAVFLSVAPITLMNGPATFPSTSSPASTTPVRRNRDRQRADHS